MVAPLEPAWRKPAGEGELHLLHIARREGHGSAGHGTVDRGAVVPGDIGHIFGRLQAAFDLERGNPRGEEFWGEGIRGQVLWREEVFLRPEINIFAIADQVVGEPTGLRALPAVGTAAAERLARQALS